MSRSMVAPKPLYSPDTPPARTILAAQSMGPAYSGLPGESVCCVCSLIMTSSIGVHTPTCMAPAVAPAAATRLSGTSSVRLGSSTPANAFSAAPLA